MGGLKAWTGLDATPPPPDSENLPCSRKGVPIRSEYLLGTKPESAPLADGHLEGFAGAYRPVGLMASDHTISGYDLAFDSYCVCDFAVRLLLLTLLLLLLLLFYVGRIDTIKVVQ